MAGNVENIGGISFAKDQVKMSFTEEKTRCDKHGNISAFTLYKVELKDGTKLTYEAQPDYNDASVYQEGKRTKLFGLHKVNVEDTNKSDKYDLYGCMGVHIQANSAKKNVLSQAIEAVGGNSDTITIQDRELKDGSIQRSFGNVFDLNKGDMVKTQGYEQAGKVQKNQTYKESFFKYDANMVKEEKVE